MAITTIEYALFSTLREQDVFPLGADMLELGEANWYGDVPLDTLAADVRRLARPDDVESLMTRLRAASRSTDEFRLWEMAKVFYGAFCHQSEPTSIDFHGTPKALKLDLNGPIDLGRRFGVVLNLGTAEHVFNIAQVFKTVHELTLPGGLMMHGLPLGGWLDHGFYNVNPTLYWDLAAANDYRVLLVVYSELNPPKLIQLESREHLHALAKSGSLGTNSLVYAVFERPREAREFRVPMQGYYAQAISESARAAWHALR